jgi:ATP-dependent Lhr-like helicase
LPGAKVALTGNRVLYRDSVAVGALVGGDIQWLEPLEAEERSAAEDLLVRQRAGSPLLAYVR